MKRPWHLTAYSPDRSVFINTTFSTEKRARNRAKQLSQEGYVAVTVWNNTERPSYTVFGTKAIEGVSWY